MTDPVTAFRRRRARRKAARLARALVVLEEHARAVRPTPRRTARVELGPRS